MLVNLQLTTENGSLNIGFGEVSAQKTQEEQLDEVEVTGSAYTECSYCHSQVEKKALSDHQSYICPERTVEYPKCHKSYKASGTCNCDDTMAGEYCPLCNQSLDVCVCDFTVTGKNRKGGGTGGTTPGGTSRGSGSSGTSGKMALRLLRPQVHLQQYQYVLVIIQKSVSQVSKSPLILVQIM